MCSHKLYARSGVASAAVASNGSRRGGGKREGHATRDCLLLLPSGSADHSNQTISRFSHQQYLRCKRDKQQDLMLLLCFALDTWRGKEWKRGEKGTGHSKTVCLEIYEYPKL